MQYPNADLARDYLRLRLAYSGRDDMVYHERRSRYIRQAGVNIAEFYQKNGSLKDLTVFGVAKETKGILEEILAKGIEQALEDVYKSKDLPVRSWRSVSQ